MSEFSLKELIQGLLQEFNKALNKCAFYNREHPLFAKAVEDFKVSTDQALEMVPVISVSIGADSLLVGGQEFSGKQYGEFARRSHRRKIKSITLKQGISREELAAFLSIMAVPLKEYLQQGGVGRFLDRSVMTHLQIEELDYLELLKSDSGEYRDVWMYLLGEVAASGDAQKMEQFVAHFPRMLRSFTAAEFIRDQDFRKSVLQFLQRLRESRSQDAARCIRELARFICHVRNTFEGQEYEHARELFERMSDAECASCIVDELLFDEAYEHFHYELFFRLVSGKNRPGLLQGCITEMEQSFLADRQNVKVRFNRVRGLCKASELLADFCQGLSVFIDSFSARTVFLFERRQVDEQVGALILELLAASGDAQAQELAARVVNREFSRLAEFPGPEFLRSLWEVPVVQAAQSGKGTQELLRLAVQLSTYVERSLWQEEPPPAIMRMAQLLPRVSLQAETMLGRMFRDGYFNAAALSVFLRFFPGSLGEFCAQLQRRTDDIALMEKIIRGVAGLAKEQMQLILEAIYSSSNAYIRKEILERLCETGTVNRAFLLGVLRDKDVFLRRLALRVLMQDKEALREGLTILLREDPQRGATAAFVLENVRIVGSLDIREAREYLTVFSNRFFLWNWGLRQAARQVLRQWKS